MTRLGHRRPRARRVAVLAAGALAASLGLSSCLVLPFVPSDDSGSGSGSPATFAPQTPPPGTTGLGGFYGQRLDWASCSGGECAKLKVPVDYEHPDGGSIEIAVLRVKARDQNRRVGSLVVNPGGPGASGVDYAKGANVIVGASVRRLFDIVGFDPRGVGRSAPIDCVTDRELDAYLGADPTPDTPAEEQAFLAAQTKLADGCAAKNPQLIAHVSTADTARDLDVLRAALGERKLTYLGKSYGTLIGSTYADLFPTLVGRMVLDGVVPPDATISETAIGQAKGFDRATRAYVEDCVKAADCPVGRTADEGMQWIRDFLKGLDSQPIPVTDDQTVSKLTEGWGSIGIAEPMYAEREWPRLTDALRAAKNGDGNGLMRLADAYAHRTPGGQYTDNLLEAINAVTCLDQSSTADPVQVRALAAQTEQVAPTMGRLFGWGPAICGVWPVKPKAPIHKVAAPGSAPIVVVGTTRDPATIYEWSVQLRQELSNAVLITWDGDGHTAYTRSNSCVDRPIDAYFVDGTVPKDGLKC